MYLNSTDDDEDHFSDALILDLTDDPTFAGTPGVYGLSSGDPGGSHGFADYVFADQDKQYFDFSVGDGMCISRNMRSQTGKADDTVLWLTRKRRPCESSDDLSCSDLVRLLGHYWKCDGDFPGLGHVAD